MTLQYYRIYVRLKSGGQATGRDLHTGRPPPSGTQLDVPLTTGRAVKARIGLLPDKKHTPGVRTKRVRTVVTLYADEI
jgi:hypothetical protein